MGEKAQNTKQRIMATAERIILQKGFAGTSIDEIIANAHITKGGFFYHFKGKNELAVALLERYLDADDTFFNELLERARSLSEDPLQQMLIFLKLLAEAMAALPETHPGCLVAAFTYESQQFDETVLHKNRAGILSWRKLFAEQLLAIEQQYQPKFASDVNDLADMLSSCLEGGIILSRVLDDQTSLSKQILHYRDYLRLLYEQP